MAAPRADGYSDVTRIARGGFGTVYRARQDRFGRVVALKVLDVVDLDERGRARFERECLAMGSLGWHPNVVAVFDSGVTDDGQPFIAMEFLDAGSLGDRLRAGPLPWREAVAAGVEVSGALGAAHAAGIFHRDLKPDNILVGPFGERKLGDFGIAAVAGAARTTTGTASFSAEHVPPEILGRQRPDERSDLYGLASTLHALIAGVAPFTSDPDDSIEAIIASVLTAPPPRLDGVPDPLADLLLRTLAKDPADRPESAAAFGGALQDVQRAAGDPVTELRLTPTPGSAPIGDTAPPVDEPALAEATVSLGTNRAVPDGRPTVRLGQFEQAPAPEAPGPEAPEAPEDGTAGRRRPRRRRAALAVGAALVLVAGAAVLVANRGGGGGGGGDAEAEPDSVVSTIDVGRIPKGVALTDDAVWVANLADDTATRVDLETEEVVATVDVGNEATAVAATDDAVWVGARRGDAVRIDPETNEVVATIDTGGHSNAVAATDTAVWIVNSDGIVTRVDPGTNELAVTIDLGRPLVAVAADDDAVWVVDVDGIMTRVDPDTDEVAARITLGEDPDGVALTETAVWVVDNRELSRIDPDTNQVVATIDLSAGAIAATDEAVWVTSFFTEVVRRVDPRTDEVVATIDVGEFPQGVAASDTDVFVSNSNSDTLTRIAP